jgi:hypothetical protein
MRRLAIGLLLIGLATGCGGTRTVTRTVTNTVTVTKQAASGDQRLYGRILSIEPDGDSYLLRFDPSWFLTGITANVAQAEDQGTTCKPAACAPVANDNYTVDESHRAFTFVLPADVEGTVLVSGKKLFPGTQVSGADLAKVVAGTSTLKLFEPLDTGIWITVHIDTVQTFAQQYHP